MNSTSSELEISISEIHLSANLNLPSDAASLVIFLHGRGSSRLSPRNRFVAERLNLRGVSTLLTDLLTPEEDAVYDNRFDVGLLSIQLIANTTLML